MNILVLILLSFLSISLPMSSSTTTTTTTSATSFITTKSFISSPKGVFTAGFFSVGINAYCFSVWFTEKSGSTGGETTVVWMANREQPVNGRGSRLSLEKNGNLVLTDAGFFTVWTSNTRSISYPKLQLLDSGNLVLTNTTTTKKGGFLWQSFDFPTNTILPNQLFTQKTILVSSTSLTNYSSGLYKLYFDNDNVLRRRYEGPEITSVFWPDPWLKSWEAGRSTYNTSKVARLDSLGHFVSSDLLKFNTSDYGMESQRIMRLDSDGNLRVYSLSVKDSIKSWDISWEASLEPCKIHGICGANSLCIYTLKTGRKCSCIPGYKMIDQTDWTLGCEPEFPPSCSTNKTDVFVQVRHAEFYGYDTGVYSNYTLQMCKQLCLQYCGCKGFQFQFNSGNGYYSCFPKTILFNGYQSLGFQYPTYIRLPIEKKLLQQSNLQCSISSKITVLDRSYKRKQGNRRLVKPFLWFTCAVGAFEITCLLIYFYKTRKSSSHAVTQGYLQVASGFRRFTYKELKKATCNFSEEIGRGGAGVVYKGILSDKRIAAVKVLEDAKQLEAEFLAEVNIIGRLNHMNLLETWGYCAEGKHRLLVYEYMQLGSVAHNLLSRNLDWEKRYKIAIGAAKGLNYLHEECLEWVLHCDVKPHNILLNENHEAKVADFGLSKLFTVENHHSSFSRIRGTRGYMAPEWVFNLPITSKVDVYSYGVVVLELVTGRSPILWHTHGSKRNGEEESVRLVTWVRDKIQRGEIKEVVDPAMNGEFDEEKMKILIEVALRCAQENKNSRPSMREVVHMLLHSENKESSNSTEMMFHVSNATTGESSNSTEFHVTGFESDVSISISV